MRRRSLALLSWFLLVPILSTAEPAVLEDFVIVDPHDFSSLTLFTDGTFNYKSRGSSCWTWGEYSGQWYRRGERLELVYTVKYPDSKSQVVIQRKQGDPARVAVFVVDPDGLPLRDIGVTFNHGTDYHATAADGSVFFDYADLPALYSFEKPESKNLEILNLKSPGTTTAMSINEKRANWFKVVYDVDPPDREEVRTDAYLVRGNDLQLLGEAAGADGPVTMRK